ncbi:MAG: HNH endonuclease [Pseudomonadales bacterium]|nr:HNH endonuclease [Candidatus Woesebacteria bacterium]MCB9800907.1 HNH endonuclease [Pseudomonadales bacterium]
MKKPRNREPYNFSRELIDLRKEKVGNVCEVCGSSDRLFGHHLVPYFLARKNPILAPHLLTRMENLQIVCEKCHDKADADQWTWSDIQLAQIAWALFNIDLQITLDGQKKKKRKRRKRHRKGKRKNTESDGT